MNFPIPSNHVKTTLHATCVVLVVTVLVIVSISAVFGSGQHLQPLAGTVGTHYDASGEDNNVSNAGILDSGTTIWLGDVNGSYLQSVYVPVYSSELGSFRDSTQIISYDPSLISFNGVIDDVASANVTLSYHLLSSDIAEIEGNGTFENTYNPSTLYYLNFTPLVDRQAMTQVASDYVQLGNTIVNSEQYSTVRLSLGWTDMGPKDIYWQNTANDSSGVAATVGLDPQNLSQIYLASGQSHPVTGPGGYPGVTGFGGMERSVDGGNSWKSIDMGLENTSITAICVNPADPEMVVIETRNSSEYPIGGAIYKTVNGGGSWQETFGEGGYGLQYTNGTLYATTFNSIISSNDFGTNWKTVSGFSSVVTASDVIDEGKIIYVGLWFLSPNYVVGVHSDHAEIMRSTNYGANYTLLANFSESMFQNLSPSISQIIVNPSSQSQIWALISTPYYEAEHGNPSLFDSMDNGATWNELNTTSAGMGVLQEPPQYITFDPSNGNIFYVAGPGFLYKSVDGGRSFESLPLGYDNRFIYVDPLNASILFAGSDQGFYESKDGGDSWIPLNNRSASLLYDVGVSGSNIIATVQDFAPLFSNDSGSQWSTIVTGELGFAAVDPYNSSNVVVWTETHTTVGGPFFFVSNDGGSSFYLPSINFTAEVNDLAGDQSITFENDTPATMYVAGGQGVFMSNDSGKNWTLLNNSPQYGLSIASSQSDPGLLYVSNYTGLFESIDGGGSWLNVHGDVIDSPSSPFPVFNSMVIDPEDSSILVAVQFLPSLQKETFGNELTGYLYISRDGGKTFNFGGIDERGFDLAPPYAYFAGSGSSQSIIFISGEGIYSSQNMGASWDNLDWNLPTNEISSFFMTPSGVSYISTYGSGIWKNSDLLNFSFALNSPVLTGYLSRNSTLYINGVKFGEEGYFTSTINQGSNTLEITSGTGMIKLILTANAGSVYYENFSAFTSPEKLYIVTFVESGLPSGTAWSVNLNSTTESSPSSSIAFSEINGTYSYSIAPVSGYNAIPSSSSLTVNGHSVNQTISFTEIKKNGCFVGAISPPNATISIFVNGSWEPYQEINGSFNISLNPGTYEVKITASGYETYTKNVTINSSVITILPVHSLSKTIEPSAFPILDVAIVVVVIFIAAATAFLFSQRVKKRRG